MDNYLKMIVLLLLLVFLATPGNSQTYVGVLRDFDSSFPDVYNSKTLDPAIPQTLLNRTSMKPLFNGKSAHPTVSNNGYYFTKSWFRDDSSYNRVSNYSITFAPSTTGRVKWGTAGWYPPGSDSNTPGKNIIFSFELHLIFTYLGTGTLAITGSDDTFAFIDGKLVVDMGGIHLANTTTVDTTTLGLTVNTAYTLDIFYFSRDTKNTPTLIIDTSLVLNCPWVDYCGVCKGDGQSCCTCGTNPNTCLINKCGKSPTDCVTTVKDCNDDNPCTVDTCDLSTGACSNTPLACDDGNVCTEDSCDINIGCSFVNINCDDFNICTQDSCNAQTGCYSTPISCDDGNNCTYDSCNAQTGCSHVPLNCNDGNACTNDYCDTTQPDNDIVGSNKTFQTLTGKWLIIPMDNSAQSSDGVFNLRAYGLATHLLHANIWLNWAILPGKQKDGIDFTASVKQVMPTTGPIETRSFRAGPFLVAPQFYTQALQVIDWFNSDSNATVNVYELAATVVAPIRHTIVHKPFVAVLNSGANYYIQTEYLDEAGFIEGIHYKVVSGEEAQSVNGSTCYTIATEPHFKSSANYASSYVIAMRKFLASGGNFLAECHGIISYENGGGEAQYDPTVGWFLTSRGIIKDNQGGSSNTVLYNDIAYMQFDGPFDSGVGGSLSDWYLPANGKYINNGRATIVDPDGIHHVAAWGKLYSNRVGTQVNYFGGHQYNVTNYQVNGVRLYLNAVMAPSDRGFSCPQLDICSNNACPPPKKDCYHEPIVCDDNNKCTTDSCNTNTGCVFTSTVCNDNNACTTDTCDPKTGCTYTLISCNDNNICTTDTCNPASGCANAAINCDDGNMCTVDTCDTSSGCKHTATNCNDNNLCTLDDCNPSSGCTHTAVDCDDHDFCTADSCLPNSGCSHTAVVCNDNNLCTSDSCDPNSGCSFNTIPLDDNNYCTLDSCSPSVGITHTDITCNDGNPCTFDSCDSSTGCQHKLNTCDDGDACTTDSCDTTTGTCTHPFVVGCVCATKTCNTTDLCNPNTCDPYTGNCKTHAFLCDDSNLCTNDVCENGECKFLPISCDDANPCTIDSCLAGVCQNTAKICDDGNLCTTDSCNIADGSCVFQPIVCNDENACTNDKCEMGTCTFTAKVCNDGNLCTTDSCNATGQCVSTPINCDDMNGCTADSCSAGVCSHTAIVCVDSNLCTIDSCVSTSSSTYACNFESKNCTDTNLCTLDSCDTATGNCRNTEANCDDNNACTNDGCDTLTGLCYSNPIVCGSDPCNPESCVQGVCTPQPITCNDGDACTTDYCKVVGTEGRCYHDYVLCFGLDPCAPTFCNQSTGLCEAKPVHCDDNNLCTIDACTDVNGTAVCKFSPITCNDSNQCTEDTCTPTTGCTFTAVNASIICDDSNVCTEDHCDMQQGECYHNATEVPIATSPCISYYCDPTMGILIIPKACPIDCTCDSNSGCVCPSGALLTAAETGIAVGVVVGIIIAAVAGVAIASISGKKAYDYLMNKPAPATNVNNNPLYEASQHAHNNPIFDPNS